MVFNKRMRKSRWSRRVKRTKKPEKKKQEDFMRIIKGLKNLIIVYSILIVLGKPLELINSAHIT